ncbi:MAG TPA: hypothetical protein PLG59_01290 [bacterium]|nr:hypothetical protein [bacterium]HQO33264.1 hypothetical protein [bacterium]HQP99781.1 hypothetical protein [bacterium]
MVMDLKKRSMLKNLVGELKKEGIQVTHASAEGFEAPYSIGRHRPDIIGTYPNGQGVVGIVRLGGSDITSGAGRQEIKDMSTRISQKTHKVIPLYIAIPATATQELMRVLKEIGLDKKDNIRVRSY